jgi:uncharacterized protein YciI
MHFVFTYEATDRAISSESISQQPAHRAWIAKLFAEKRLILAGPFTEDLGGMAIVEAPNKQAAEELLNEDPAIANGTFRATVRELKVIYGL